MLLFVLKVAEALSLPSYYLGRGLLVNSLEYIETAWNGRFSAVMCCGFIEGILLSGPQFW